jgi:hypothetical protein
MADLSIASLHTECSNIRFQLNRIQNLILRNGDRFESYVMEEYQSLLEACSISFFVLNRHFEALGLTMVGKMTQQTVVEQVKLLWEHRQMEIVSHSIIGQARAIGVLFNAFASFVIQKPVYVPGKDTNQAQGKSNTGFGNYAKSRSTTCP